MARYIDANQLISDLEKLNPNYVLGNFQDNEFVCGTLFGIRQAILYIKVQPTTDATAKSEIVAEIIDDLAREGLLNIEPWAIAELKRKYREEL